MLLIGSIFLITLPWTSIGVAAMWYPSILEYLPVSYLKILVRISNANVIDYYAVLDLASTASRELVSQRYRKLALLYHPDKIPHDTSEAEKIAMTEKFAKIAEANDMLSRERNAAAPELKEMLPRCTAASFLCFYWVLHMSMDFLEIETQTTKQGEELRKAIASSTQETLPMNIKHLGVKDRTVIEEWCKHEHSQYCLPWVRENNLKDLIAFRERLTEAGIELEPLPEGLAEDTPLFLPRVQQAPPPQEEEGPPPKPPWITDYIMKDEQKDNILTMCYKGEEDRLLATIRGTNNMVVQTVHAAISPGNRSTVYLAAIGGHAGVIKMLAAHGAKIRMPDDGGFTPLHMACIESHQKCVKTLLELKADVEAAGENGVTSLHVSSAEDHIGITKYLVKAKAKLEARDSNGETPLFAAARSNSPAAVRYLASAKADINALTNGKLSPMWVAAMMGQHGSMAALIELDADASIGPTTVEPAALQNTSVEEACRLSGNQPSLAVYNKLVELKGEVDAAKEESRKVTKTGTKDQIESSLAELMKKTGELKAACKEYEPMDKETTKAAKKEKEAKEAKEAIAKETNSQGPGPEGKPIKRPTVKQEDPMKRALSPGEIVTINGVKSKPELNGLIVKVVGKETEGRVEVETTDGKDDRFSLKRDTLHPSAPKAKSAEAKKMD